MLESFMEDLLWRFPDDFFPRHGFKQATRQFTLSDGGRLDISFRDASQRLWVIEVKAVAIRTDAADQVIRYVEALRAAQPHDAPIPAVVAPLINATVRSHFDRWGIEYFEISEATFRRVANERGIAMEQLLPVVKAPQAAPTTAVGGASLRAMSVADLLALREQAPRADLKLHYKIRVALRAHGYYISKNR